MDSNGAINGDVKEEHGIPNGNNGQGSGYNNQRKGISTNKDP